MRLKYNCFKWPIRTRAYIACAVWCCIAVISFFCSKPGEQFTNWTKENLKIAAQKSHRNLRQVEVNWLDPTHYTKTEEILKVIGVKQGDPMADIELKDLQEKVEQMPWVRTAVVERFWPDVIKITLKEKTPLALWQNNRQHHPLDDKAEIIDTSKGPADLLLVVGRDAPEHLIALIKDLEQVPDIYQYVRAAVRVGERRWNLRLFNAEKGLDVLLPETNVLSALKRLETHNKQEKLIKRQIAAIDLRMADKVILRPLSMPKGKEKVKKK